MDLNIPTVTWPGNKKVALNISIHFEEGAEATVGQLNAVLPYCWSARLSRKQPENGDEYSEVLMGEVCPGTSSSRLRKLNEL